MEEKKEILRVENLKKYFYTPGGVLHAVDDISFTIKEGETLGVVGESGCGKSTMGRTILRLHERTDGKVFFQGNNIFEYNKQQMKALRKDMQIIFQEPVCFFKSKNDSQRGDCRASADSESVQ